MLQPELIFFLFFKKNSCKRFRMEFKVNFYQTFSMDKNNIKKQNVYLSEEEKTLVWEDIRASFKKNFGSEIYNSWLQKLTLEKEFNDYLILGVPTRFFRDWIVSRYLDKIL